MKFPRFLRMSAAETIYNRGIAEGVWGEETLKSKIRLVARFRGTQDVAHGKSLLLRQILLGITVPQTLVMKSPPRAGPVREDRQQHRSDALHLNENNPIEARLIKECRHGIAETSDIKKTLEKLDGGI